jgi:hypothetical protein
VLMPGEQHNASTFVPLLRRDGAAILPTGVCAPSATSTSTCLDKQAAVELGSRFSDVVSVVNHHIP